MNLQVPAMLPYPRLASSVGWGLCLPGSDSSVAGISVPGSFCQMQICWASSLIGGEGADLGEGMSGWKIVGSHVTWSGRAFNEYLLRGISKECKHSPARTIVYIWSSWKRGASCITVLLMLAHCLTTSGRFVRAVRTVFFMITIPTCRNTGPRGAMELIALTRPSGCSR